MFVKKWSPEHSNQKPATIGVCHVVLLRISEKMSTQPQHSKSAQISELCSKTGTIMYQKEPCNISPEPWEIWHECVKLAKCILQIEGSGRGLCVWQHLGTAGAYRRCPLMRLKWNWCPWSYLNPASIASRDFSSSDSPVEHSGCDQIILWQSWATTDFFCNSDTELIR